MRRLRNLVPLLLVVCGVPVIAYACSRQLDDEAHNAAPQPLPVSVRDELIEMGRRDQEPRLNLTPERMQDTTFLRELMQGDSARTARLREIVEQYGWPIHATAGEEAAGAAFLVLQHSPDHAFQKTMAAHLELLARNGEVPRPDVAMLVDRVLMHDGLPQRYGTQFAFDDGRWIMHPVEDEGSLDERRREMDLATLNEYMRRMEGVYGSPVVRR